MVERSSDWRRSCEGQYRGVQVRGGFIEFRCRKVKFCFGYVRRGQGWFGHGTAYCCPGMAKFSPGQSGTVTVMSRKVVRGWGRVLDRLVGVA